MLVLVFELFQLFLWSFLVARFLVFRSRVEVAGIFLEDSLN